MSNWIRKEDDVKTIIRLIKETAETLNDDLFWYREHDKKQFSAIAWMCEMACKRIDEIEELWQHEKKEEGQTAEMTANSEGYLGNGES